MRQQIDQIPGASQFHEIFRLGAVNTANGRAPAYRVKLDSVKIGTIELNQVDALIQENGLPIALLGMSFLNRMDMRRNGDQMTLTKRF